MGGVHFLTTFQIFEENLILKLRQTGAAEGSLFKFLKKFSLVSRRKFREAKI